MDIIEITRKFKNLTNVCEIHMVKATERFDLTSRDMILIIFNKFDEQEQQDFDEIVDSIVEEIDIFPRVLASSDELENEEQISNTILTAA